MNLILAFILVVSVRQNTCVKDLSKKINAEGYLYPDHFWQLDYSTDVEDVLENTSPTVYGDESLTIAGEGRGYLKYKASVSSATLSTFQSPCFIDVSQCSSGITYAFWFLIGRVVTSYDGAYQLLTLQPKDNGNQQSRMRVMLVLKNGHLTLQVSANSDQNQSVEKQITAGRWYHVVMEENLIGGTDVLNVYLNLVNIGKVTNVRTKTLGGSAEMDLFLGKPVDGDVSAAFRNAEISIDNLAIWKRTLNDSEKARIYFAEFGKIGAVRLTGNTERPFEVSWNTSYNYYSQVESYTIEWWSGNEIANKVVYPIKESLDHGKELTAYLEIFENGKECTVSVQADLIDAGATNPSVEGKFTIDGKVSGSKVMTYSDSISSIKVTWKVRSPDPDMSVFMIAHNKSGTVVEERSVTSKSLEYTLTDLIPNTVYQVKVTKEGFDPIYQVVYSRNVKTRSVDFYQPPFEIKLLNSSESSLTLAFLFSEDVLNNTRIITHVNIHVSDGNGMNDVIETGLDQSAKVISGLVQYTEYKVYAASGDGQTFGKISKFFHFRTKDENECINNDACGGNMICRNNPGSFTCACPNGLFLINGTCQDTNECLNVDQCDVNEECVNSFGSFKCLCKLGFIRKDGKCSDVDECSNVTACGEDAIFKRCTNNEGSFHCSCKDGFTQEGNACKDINECGNGSACGEDAQLKTCVNNIGSFKCHCNDGYKADGRRCIDVDECLNTTACGVDSALKRCVNSVGSFNCHCIDGYQTEGDRCKDVNECTNRTACGMDSELKTCVNNAGSFKCVCNDGYTMEGDRCKDIDECTNTAACGEDNELKTCVNSVGSFACICKRGYEEKDGRCADIDECLNDTVCGEDRALKRCVNTVGSFNCHCVTGYTMVGNLCKDVNECAGSRRCGVNFECRNLPGTFECRCGSGFERKGNMCTKVVKPLCRREFHRNITWRQTFNEEIVTAPCPAGTIGNASRACVRLPDKTLYWGNLDLSGCVSQRWNDIVSFKHGKTSSAKVATKLKSFVEEETLFGGDVTNVVGMMGNLAIENEKETDNFTEIVIDVTSNLLDDKAKGAWNDLPEDKRSQDAGQLLETTDAVIESAAKKSTESSRNFVTENVEIRLQKILREDEMVLDYLVAGNTVTLPDDALELDENNPVMVAVVSYKGLSKLIGVPSNTEVKKNGSGFIINSEVTSVSLFPQTKKRFRKPVVIVQRLSQKMNNTIPHCTFWDKDVDRWSDEGCQVFASNDTHVTCHCYHLTSFVVLMTVSDAHSNMTGSHRFALGLISTIGIGISLLGMFASYLTFIFVRVIRSIRNTIHQHLVVALFIAQLVFLFGVERIELHIGCQVIAALIHYFFLVAFFIMGLEGIVLYFMLVRVYRSMGTSGYGSVKYVIWCWVLPIIFILINLIIDDEAYKSHSEYCWLSLRNGYIWSFVGPVLLIILANFFILCMTLRVMTEKAKKRTSAVDEIWFWMKGSCLLLSILGVTWVLGIFYVDQQTVFIAYLFNIINSLQGFSIFVFHCLCDPRVRKAYRQFFCCLDKKEQSLIRAHTRSTPMSSSLKTKKKMSYSNGTSPAEVSLMSSPGGTSTPNDSFGVLVGATKL